MTNPAAHVLIVSPDAQVLGDFQSLLSETGFKVNTVTSAHDALALSRSRTFDVLVVDALMPDASGAELVQQLKMDQSYDAEVVMMCPAGDLDRAAQAIELGAYDVLVTPVPDPAIILWRVRRAYQHRLLVRDRERMVEFLAEKTNELEAKNSQLDRSLERLAAIELLGRELSLIDHADRVQRAVVDAVVQQLGAQRVCFLLFDDERCDLRIAASHGVEVDEITGLSITLPAEAALWGKECNTRFSVENDGDGTFFSEERYLTKQFVSTPNRLEVPLTQGRNFYGVLCARDAANPFRTRDLEFISILAAQAATTLENLKILLEMKKSYIEVIHSLVNAIEMKDAYTSGHSRRVTRYTKAIARHMGLSRPETEIIANGALLHDVGKIGMRLEVINHPGRLSEIEFQEFRKHPTLGRTILAPSRAFRELVPMVYLHHERCDGRGYPTGMAGEEIPLGARIVTVADAFDAMTSHRAYCRALPKTAAIEELVRCAGTQFDPQVIDVFVDALGSGKIEAFDEISGVGTTPDTPRKKKKKKKKKS